MSDPEPDVVQPPRLGLFAKAVIALELVGFAFLVWLGVAALTWPGSENWAAVGYLIYGGPTLIALLSLMIAALIAIARSPLEPEDKALPRWVAVGPVLVAIGLTFVIFVEEMR